VVTNRKVYKLLFYPISEVNKMKQEQYGRLERQETKIRVPHRGGELTVIHPFLRGNYFNLAKKIDDRGLKRPTMAETASLVKYGYANSDDIAENIRETMKSNYFYTFNGILYTPNGVLFQDNPEFPEDAQTANDLSMNEQDLISRLGSKEEKGIVFSEDGKTRFLKGYDFKREYQTHNELSKNPFVVALAGEEGAEKLAYIASQHKEKPYLYALEPVKEPVKRVAALDSDWDGGRLDVIGDYQGVNVDWCSFGVR
jgi:hypothetical protein